MTKRVVSPTDHVKSQLLPLSPLDRCLEWIVECLPRQCIRHTLELAHDIAVINTHKGEYKATGYEPSFRITVLPETVPEGWYYIEAALTRNNGNRKAWLRAEILGKGCIIIPVPTNLRGTIREVFYLPPKVQALYWFPTAAPGFFSQSQLLIHKITLLEGIFRRMHRILFDLRRFRGKLPTGCRGLSWWRVLGNLQDAYQRTATLRINRMMGNDYPSYIALNDTLNDADIRAMREQVLRFRLVPVLSLIMPIQTPQAKHFRDALDSVSRQIYPHWELLLIGDFSADSQAHSIAKDYQRKHKQIQVISIRSGANLTKIFNSALEQARGEFVARINQNDLLPPHALFCLSEKINRHPDTEFIYTDDDNIDEMNERFAPRFKPDWNPDLFFSHNYILNLALYSRSRVLKLGGYRPGFAGAEDYDLLLRYLKELPAPRIKHIPRILYHSRTARRHSSPPSSSYIEVNSDAEIDIHQSGKQALKAIFIGTGIKIEDGPTQRLYRLKHPLPAQLPLVTIIIPTRDRVDLLKNCIESIRQKTAYEKWEMLIVDNLSVETQTFSYFVQIQRDPRIKVIRYEKPFNFSVLNNYAVKFAQGEILALVNNDIEVIASEWLSEMVSYAIQPDIGAVGAKLLYINGLVQHAGVILGLGGVAGHAHRYLKSDDHGYCHRAVVTQNLSAVTGACLVVRVKCYKEVGGLNENDLAVAFNDIDFCLKLIAAGYRNVLTPYALLYHHESMSRGHDNTSEKHALFLREFSYMKNTWGKALKHDPAYNQNLTTEFENFTLNLSRLDKP